MTIVRNDAHDAELPFLQLTINSIPVERHLFIIYHADCMDGFLAAKVVYENQSLPHDRLTHILPMKYGDEIPFDYRKYHGSDVIFVDFCPTLEQLTLMSEDHPYEGAVRRLNSITIIDHHKSSYEMLRSFVAGNHLAADGKSHAMIRIYCDVTRSAYEIASDLYEPERYQDVNWLRLASRYDLWKHDGDTTSDEHALAVAFNEMVLMPLRNSIKSIQSEANYKAWSSAAYRRLTGAFILRERSIRNTSVYKLVEAGKQLEEGIAEEAKKIVEGAQQHKDKNGNVWVVYDCEKHMVNHVASAVARIDENSILSVFVREGEAPMSNVSLRSGKVKTIDCSLLAKKMDLEGGGHPGAAGYRTSRANQLAVVESLLATIDLFTGSNLSGSVPVSG